MSRTNIEISDRLVAEGFRLTHLRTKKELVNFALEELVARMKRRKILKYEGKVKWEGNLDESRLSRV
jgi:Arc/MetJ family transcription regulator